MRSRTAPLLLLPGLGFLLLFFVVPSLVMLFAPPGTGPVEVIARVGEMLTDPYELRIIGRTVGIGLVVTLICVVLGFPIAYLLARAVVGGISRQITENVSAAGVFAASTSIAVGLINAAAMTP